MIAQIGWGGDRGGNGGGDRDRGRGGDRGRNRSRNGVGARAEGIHLFRVVTVENGPPFAVQQWCLPAW